MADRTLDMNILCGNGYLGDLDSSALLYNAISDWEKEYGHEV